MKRAYRKMVREANGKVREIGPGDRVSIELPLPLAQVLAVECLALEAGLVLMAAVMEAEAREVVGPRHARIPDRRVYRWGSQPGRVVYAGQRVALDRPRLRRLSGTEMTLSSYGLFGQDGRMQRAVHERMLLGVSTRKYEQAVGEFLRGYGVRKSSVSRSFIKASARELQALWERDLSSVDLRVILIDGIEFKGHLLVVALGIDTGGRKQVLGHGECRAVPGPFGGLAAAGPGPG